MYECMHIVTERIFASAIALEITNSPPRRIHSGCEHKQEQNKGKVYPRGVFGVVSGYCAISGYTPDPHSLTA